MYDSKILLLVLRLLLCHVNKHADNYFCNRFCKFKVKLAISYTINSTIASRPLRLSNSSNRSLALTSSSATHVLFHCTLYFILLRPPLFSILWSRTSTISQSPISGKIADCEPLLPFLVIRFYCLGMSDSAIETRFLVTCIRTISAILRLSDYTFNTLK